jgi:hypothetical protein
MDRFRPSTTGAGRQHSGANLQHGPAADAAAELRQVTLRGTIRQKDATLMAAAAFEPGIAFIFAFCR